ncbi:hypothetical protein POM88_016386 [Heracleum sosnowskyi]|uniref:Uncharacterized protein n=1 Tax=Heracleum sosnowskyi TaxID=360622 RepID=A0AAD8IN79_9APIA|nr:hypothetical protein POM88_016386 [Heracleum sosnowskyi]
MCGGAIISDFMLPSRTTRRVNAADLLWDPSSKNDKTRTYNYYSKPLIADLDEDFEADFQGFNDDEILVKPLSFSPKGVENVRKNGMIRDVTGFVTFPVTYQCVVFRPFKGEILEVVVTRWDFLLKLDLCSFLSLITEMKGLNLTGELPDEFASLANLLRM